MDNSSMASWVTGGLLVMPLFMLLIQVVAAAVDYKVTECHLRRVFAVTVVAVLGFSAALLALLLLGATVPELTVGGALLYYVDRPAAYLLLVSTTIISVAGNFSLTYLHRDPGFHRYFLAFSLFFVGITHLFSSAHVALLAAAWELLAISSVLLIGYYSERTGPVRSSALALSYYRVGDVGLLSGLAMFSLITGSGQVPWLNPAPVSGSLLAGLAIGGLVIGAAAKSALVPFGPWLPRAMEGPTPSSATYYGALSVHAGIFLLWRLHDQLADFCSGSRDHNLCRALWPGSCGHKDAVGIRLDGPPWRNVRGNRTRLNQHRPLAYVGAYGFTYPADALRTVCVAYISAPKYCASVE
jgi:NADH:ubiquinone oxidoreductase subunit 5 (subunit L)/multisubunit Na+/H+ antiporter MnhA subunit